MAIELDPAKKYYSVSEVAKMFGMNISKLRFWEERFSRLQPKRTSGGDRKYTHDDIHLVETIIYLVEEKGYKLEGANEVLAEEHKRRLQNNKLIVKLEALKGFLVELRDSMDEVEEQSSEGA
jgi:DNA-binding transcriptional MerR regulator